MKKYVSLLLAIIMLFSVSLPVIAYAGTSYSVDSVALLQEDDFDIYEEGYSSQNANITDSAKNAIINGLRNVSATISLSLYRITISDFKIAYTSIINDNPEFFYVSSSYGYSYSGSYIKSVTPGYSMDKSEIEDAKIIFNNGVNSALSLVDETMTDEQKVVTIHDYLCTISRYPKDISNDQNIWHSAYGIFYNGDTVCAGYSLAFSYLMNRLGIPSVYVISDSMKHAWNAVQIDGSWYYLDLTFDDLGYFGDFNIRGAMLHRYFLKSEETFSSEYCTYHNEFKKPDYVVCENTKYDDYFWNDLTTNIKVVGGKYYYLSTSSSTRYANLVERDMDGNQSNLLSTADEIYYTYSSLSSSATDSSGASHSIPFKDYLIRLDYMDARFYISSYNYVYSFAPNDKLYYVFKSSDTISTSTLFVGLGNDGDNIITQVRGENGVSVVRNKIDYFKAYFAPSGEYNNYVDIDNNGYLNAIDYLLITK